MSVDTSNSPDEVKQKNSGATDFSERLLGIKYHFGRFLWDILGVVLLALALISLLGLFGLTQGTLMRLWVDIIKTSFGWGSVFIIAATAVFGIYALRRSYKKVHFHWDQLIGIELLIFVSLGLLSIVSGNQLSAAEQGKWGGQIGWGIASMLSQTLGIIWGGVFLSLLWVIALITSGNLWKYLENWVLQQAGDEITGESVALHSDISSKKPDDLVISPLVEPRSTLNQKKSTIPLEFRKNFKIPSQSKKSTAANSSRSDLLPPLNLLVSDQASRTDERSINQIAGLIEKTLSEFGIPAKVVGFRSGPSVTQYAVQPGFIRKGEEEDAQLLKVRVAQIASLQKDLALALSAERLRIEAPVPGRAFVGIEVPNTKVSLVHLRPLIESESFLKVNSPLTIALGRDVSGNPVVADLSRMPHLLIAGTTGSGKSVCIASLVTCLAINNSPDDLKMVLIDSKMVELIRFNGLPHLYGKVETDVNRILGVLRWVVTEMEHRYKLLEAARARDIAVYNNRMQRRKDARSLPRIVVMIDELADLMMSAPDQTEHNLVRLAQMARATGIHLVVATQRPSTDVVTGLIKANFPCRIAFAVASGVDSRVILDLPGAESLLGRGDLLFLNPEIGNLLRAQGVLMADQEIERLIAHWQTIYPKDGTPPPWETLLNEFSEKTGDDVLLDRAITILNKENRASASLLQRKLNIGYPRAARLLDQLEEMNIIGPPVVSGRDRDVLLSQKDTEDTVNLD
jgi:S-DNA-T family DNA segregation ATPase FtsK/SpoIIIE